jgi:hypothetical protein
MERLDPGTAAWISCDMERGVLTSESPTIILTGTFIADNRSVQLIAEIA